MAIFLLAMAGGYCFLGAFLGMRYTRAPIHQPLATLNPQPEPGQTAAIAEPCESTAEPAAEAEPGVVASASVETLEPNPPPELARDSDQSTNIAQAESPGDLPADWMEILGTEHPGCSALEAAALVLRTELQGYRESLVDLETHLRVVQMNLNEVSQFSNGHGDLPDEDNHWRGSLESSRTQLRQLHEQWCARLSGIMRELRAADFPADHEDVLDNFQQALQREVGAQEKLREEFARLPGKMSEREAVQKLLLELPPLMSHCHTLEPLLQTTLITLAVRQDRLSQWESSEFSDPATHLRNRAGMELWLRQWRADESNRQRQLSAIMLDVDNSAALNTQWGSRIGDLILNSLGTMINGVLRKNRGVDFTVRYTGQRYIVVLADTGPRGANSAAERIRQTIEQCYFEHPFGKIQVTISAGVSDIRSHDSLETLFDRLQRAIRTAKQAGRNCAALDEGTGPVCLMAPQLRIREHSAASTIQEVEQELLTGQTELAAV